MMTIDRAEPTHQPLSLKPPGPRLSNGPWSAEPAGYSVSRPLGLLASELPSHQAPETMASWPLAQQLRSRAAQRPLSFQASKPLCPKATEPMAPKAKSR